MGVWLDDLFTPIEQLPPPDPVPVIDTRQAERTILYWPGGVAANGVALTEAAITTLLNQAILDGVARTHLVIDGANLGGVVPMSGSHNGFASVTFVNVTTLQMTHASNGQALFRNTSRIVAERPLVVTRTVTSINTAFLRCDIVGANLAVYIENIRFHVFASGSNFPTFVVLRNGARRVEFQNCATNTNLGQGGAPQVLLVETVAPSSLDIYWLGEYAGKLSGGNLFYTDSIGAATWTTSLYYGSVYGAMLTPAVISGLFGWDGGTIDIYDARIVNNILQRELISFDYLSTAFALQPKVAGSSVVGDVVATFGTHAGSAGVLLANGNSGSQPAFSLLLWVPPSARFVRITAVVIGGGSEDSSGNATLELSCGAGGSKVTRSFAPSRTTHEVLVLYEGMLANINAPGQDGLGAVGQLSIGRASVADAWAQPILIKRLMIEWAQLSLL